MNPAPVNRAPLPSSPPIGPPPFGLPPLLADANGNPLWRPMEFREEAGTPQQNRVSLQAVQNPDQANRPEGNVTY